MLCLPRTLCILNPYTLVLPAPPRCYRSCLTLARSLLWHNRIYLLASHCSVPVNVTSLLQSTFPSTHLPFNLTGRPMPRSSHTSRRYVSYTLLLTVLQSLHRGGRLARVRERDGVGVVCTLTCGFRCIHTEIYVVLYVSLPLILPSAATPPPLRPRTPSKSPAAFSQVLVSLTVTTCAYSRTGRRVQGRRTRWKGRRMTEASTMRRSASCLPSWTNVQRTLKAPLVSV